MMNFLKFCSIDSSLISYKPHFSNEIYLDEDTNHFCWSLFPLQVLLGIEHLLNFWNDFVFQALLSNFCAQNGKGYYPGFVKWVIVHQIQEVQADQHEVIQIFAAQILDRVLMMMKTYISLGALEQAVGAEDLEFVIPGNNWVLKSNKMHRGLTAIKGRSSLLHCWSSQYFSRFSTIYLNFNFRNSYRLLLNFVPLFQNV